MNTVQLRDAKAKLSALVDAAERGEATTITRHGKPAAVLVPVDQAQQLSAQKAPSLATLLMSIPYAVPIRRSRSRPRKATFE